MEYVSETDAQAANICIALRNPRNAQLIADMLPPHLTVRAVEPKETPPLDDIDLYIVDVPTAMMWTAHFQATRARAHPYFLPFLLLSNDARELPLDHPARAVIDDELIRPVPKAGLRARITALLRTRWLTQEVTNVSRLYEHERVIAQNFQEAAMPRVLPSIDGYRLSAAYHPGKSDSLLGGDWYDAVELSEGRILLSIGDVVGSGLAAAVTMGAIRQVIRGVAYVHADPAAMLAAANQVILIEYPDRFVTAFAAIFETATRRLRYANAGHPRPLVRSGGDIFELASIGTMLGVENVPWLANHEVFLPAGFDFIAFTDGLTEADRDITAGESHLRQIIGNNISFNDSNAARHLYENVLPNGAPDDVAILVCHDLRDDTRDGLSWQWAFESADVQTYGRVKNDFDIALDTCGVSRAARMIPKVVLSEMLGNVVRHAPGRLELILEFRRTAGLVINVFDDGPPFRYERSRKIDIMAESGRGLFMISAMAKEFSIEPRAGGGNHTRAVLDFDLT